ncbi:coproporphyrinogen dehydrogenase HemZ [Ruminococcus sp.]|uniref:coproporphyrinogen dehydrogenase HemZ n=1 Tax=Ruminococcus sp. TaxID=41978 RepID=UPI00388F2616
MNLYIDHHTFHYEMENLCRAFLFTEDVAVIHEYETLTAPYILTSVRESVRVELCTDTLHETLTAPLSDDNELCMGRLLYQLLCQACGRELPWGILTGVRPIKLFSKLAARDGVEEARRYFRETLYVSDEKIALAEQVRENQRAILARSGKRSFSLYVSIPFCPTRCNYCSFVSQTVERAKKLIDRYLPLLHEELRCTARLARELELTLASVYIGGGTPTTLSAEQLDLLLSEIEREFDLSRCAEFTVEAGRPDTVTREKLLALRRHPVTRISINPQTFNDSVLEHIGRRHDSQQTLDAYRLARTLGFDNINMDLIAGLTTDTPASFENTINIIRALDPESVTVHTLAVKRSARLASSDAVKEQAYTARMLAYAARELTDGGWEPYYLYRQSKMLSNLENIGWAKQGFFSPYNVYIMEETHTILACGAGGVTKLRDTGSDYLERIFNFKYPYEYISRFDELLERKARVKTFYSEYNK